MTYRHGTCGTCGVAVVWDLLPSGKFAPPYEETGYAGMILHEGQVLWGDEIQHHHCTKEAKAEHAKLKKAWAKRQKVRNEFHQAALDNAAPQLCPRCGASPYMPCTNMQSRDTTKYGTPNKWPHTERYTPEFRQEEN